MQLSDLDKLTLAYYYSEFEMKYADIAQIFGVSEATVSRVIKELKQKGYISQRPILKLPAEQEQELHSKIREMKTAKALIDKFKPKGLRTAIVAPSRGVLEAKEVTRRVTLAAARFIENTFASGKHVVGMLWGPTLRFTVDALNPKQQNSNIVFVPLRGGLGIRYDDINYEFIIQCYSNVITNIIAYKFGAKSLQLDVPAFIPRKFENADDKLDVILDFIEQDISYQGIFGGHRRNNSARPQEALISKIDTILTGIGSAELSGAWIKWTNHISNQDKTKLKSYGIVGDIGCHFIPDDTEFARKANERVVGVDLKDFLSLASRNAAENNPPGAGVVAIASGANKVAAIHWCLLHGMINVLITDEETAKAILDL